MRSISKPTRTNHVSSSCLNLRRPSNYKDPEKIAAYILEAKAKQVSKLALDPACCRIVAIGTCLDGTVTATVCPDVDVERKALTQFWETWDAGYVGGRIGYNCIAFDLPVLLTRSRILGVPAPKLTLRKYGSPEVRDLMLELSFGGLVDYKSLNFWAKRLKLDVPKDDTTGKDIAALVSSADWNSVAHHVSVDVLKTYALAEYLNLL